MNKGTLIDNLIFWRSLWARIKFGKAHCNRQAEVIIAQLNETKSAPPTERVESVRTADYPTVTSIPHVPQPRPDAVKKPIW